MSHTLQLLLPSYKFATVFAKIKATFVALNNLMVTRATRQRAYRELSSLTNRELNDIGLTRGDIWAVVNDRFYDDSIRERETTSEVNKNLNGWA